MKPYEPRRSVEPRSRWNATAWICIAIAWVLGIIGLAWIVVSIAVSLAASSSAPDGSPAAVARRLAQSGTPHDAGVEPRRQSSPAVVAAGGVPQLRNVPATTAAQLPEVMARTEALGAMVEAEIGSVLLAGDANFADPIHGSEYLAMRFDRGTPVTITGAGGTWVTRTTDYGPAKSTGDIADIALVRFAAVCGWSIEEARRRGECDVTIELLGEIRLPATDTKGAP